MRDRVFISYRRDDSEADAGRLYADLVREFTSDRVFKDVDNIPVGGIIQHTISDAIGASAVVLVLIGPNWSTERLANRDDWVRMEIASAIEKRVPIIPILLRRAKMPGVSELPAELTTLADHNAAELEHSSWPRDLVPLVEEIRRNLDQDRGARSGGEQQTGSEGRRNPISGRLVSGFVALIAIVAVLAAIIVSRSPDQAADAPAATPLQVTDNTQATTSSSTIAQQTTSALAVDESATSSPSAEPSVASTQLIPITLDSALVSIEAPAVLADEGHVLFPEDEAGEVTVRFTATASGSYVVWARVRIPADVTNPVNANSLYAVAGANLARSDEFVWDFWENNAFPDGSNWEWDRVSRRGATGTVGDHVDDPFTVPGRAAQEVVFTLGGRELGVAIERIYVTTDATWQPPECAASTVCSYRGIDFAAETND